MQPKRIWIMFLGVVFGMLFLWSINILSNYPHEYTMIATNLNSSAPVLLTGNTMLIDIEKIKDMNNSRVKKIFDITKEPIVYNYSSVKDSIIFLGDSYTYGSGVKENETFSALVSNSVDCNIINLGIPGINLIDEINRLKIIGLEFEPKVVFLQLSDNDYQRTFLFWTLTDEIFRTAEKKKTYSPENRWLRLQSFRFYEKEFVIKNYSSEINKTIIEPLFELKEISQEYHFDVYIIAFDFMVLSRANLKETFSELGYHLIDLNATIGWESRPPYQISKNDPHFSREYNSKVADLIERIIDEDNLCR